MQDPVAAFLDQVVREAEERRQWPSATYRLQFHAGFTFRDAIALVPYFRELGISHCYSSPYLKARPGSTHGYDIINHHALNPEVGSEADFDAWVAALKGAGLEQILDIVPNHMGITGGENVWWNDVLENGPASPYASYFDIAWYASPRPELHGKVLLPILGEPFAKVLESQQIQLRYAGGVFTLHYFDHRLPVAPRSYAKVLSAALPELSPSLPADAFELAEYQSILTAIEHLPRRTEARPEKLAERQREKEVIKRRLAALTEQSPPVKEAVERIVHRYNGVAGDPRSFDLLDQLLEDQAYRLADWRVAADEINYRRFFDINDLAALSMERLEVFQATHESILRWLAEGRIVGLRIDHVDGLFAPRQYLERLQRYYILACARRKLELESRGLEWGEVEAALGPIKSAGSGANGPHWPLYVVVEKILAATETLPDDWPAAGTSGYDFLNFVNGLFVDASNAQTYTTIYQDFTQDDTPFSEVVYQKKYLILQTSLSSELHMLAHQLDRLAQKSRWSRDFTFHGLHHALRDIIACFPVYRSYITDSVREADAKYVQAAVRRAKLKNPALSAALFDFVRDMLLLNYPASATEDDRAEQRLFVGKFQQVSAPVMAKGLEDTAFYSYNRLVSLNEVGGDPARFGLAPGVVHRYLQDRQQRWPCALSASSTHDSKRSEDVRARLNVLSELPTEWFEAVTRWTALNRRHRIEVEEAHAPDANEEYLFYQTLVGAFPLDLLARAGKPPLAPDPWASEAYSGFVTRIHAYMRKAIHEAKVHTSWINPNPAYDNAVWEFVAAALNPEISGEFLADVCAFTERISHFGLLNSLAQLVLKTMAPGVPDIYQGCELWDFSLVDPDNRRPVDYVVRRKMLRELLAATEAAGADRRTLARELLAHKEDGRVKLYVTQQTLQLRRRQPLLFRTGEYLPLEISGGRADHAFGFARRHGESWALAAVPRFLARLAGSEPGSADVWQDTAIVLPADAPAGDWLNLFTGEAMTATDAGGQLTLPLARLFADFPVAVLNPQE